MTDNIEVARQIDISACENDVTYEVLIEIDCGDHRGGLPPDSDVVIEIAETLRSGPARLRGVLTHAGHAYAVDQPGEMARIAEEERCAAVRAAERLRQAGHPVDMVSVGSTPAMSAAICVRVAWSGGDRPVTGPAGSTAGTSGRTG